MTRDTSHLSGASIDRELARRDVEHILRRIPGILSTDRYSGEHVIGEGLGGESIIADFILSDIPSPSFPDGLAFIVRVQRGSGTTDEKLYMLGVNLPACARMPVVVVLIGDGHRPGIIEWLRRRTGRTFLAVVSARDLESWLWLHG